MAILNYQYFVVCLGVNKIIIALPYPATDPPNTRDSKHFYAISKGTLFLAGFENETNE